MTRNFTLAILLTLGMVGAQAKDTNTQAFSGYTVAEEGAWCWFADPRALHYESKDGSINATYIGYIDVHGNIKAKQTDWITGMTEEVLVRSYFQPDDHNNPAFLVLPDERVMIIYSRHTDEPCFYYRISTRKGDITSLGEEKILKTRNNTTYPNPFILSSDPQHIYMCWRGIGWHPTIARMTMPDEKDNIRFDWGPYQMVQSSGARPYAKYISDGKDKIYLAYTTGHPDNEYPNWLYCNVFNVKTRQLEDIKGNIISTVGTPQVQRTEDYLEANPYAVVDHTADSRDWLWNMAFDKDANPLIGMTHISEDKKHHSYYYARWNGNKWNTTFITNAGGHFHQTAYRENCYSGGMAIDRDNPRDVYCSVPVNGTYEIKKYTMNETLDAVIDSVEKTRYSSKNNARPFVIENSSEKEARVLWMNGDYYYWIVNTEFPKGYPTGIRSLTPLPKNKQKARIYVSFDLTEKDMWGNGTSDSLRTIFKWGDISYALDGKTLKPTLCISGKAYNGQNRFATADSWATDNHTLTDGKWHKPVRLTACKLNIVHDGRFLTIYRDGLIDQRIECELPKGKPTINK